MTKAGKIGETPMQKKGKQVGLSKTITKPPSDRKADLDQALEWQPHYSGSGRLAGKAAIVTGGDSSYMSGQVLHPNGGTIVNG